MDLLTQTALIVALTALGLSGSVLARNARNKLYIAYSALTGVVSLWALFFFLERVFETGVFYDVHLFLNIWIAPAAMVFIGSMVGSRDSLSRKLSLASWIFAVALSIAMVAGVHDEVPVAQAILFLPSIVLIEMVWLTWKDRVLQVAFGDIRRGAGRRLLIYVGAILVVSICTMDHVPILGNSLPAIGNLALAVYFFFLSQALTRQRFLNFGILVSRFLVLLAVALVLTAIYSLLFAWIENSPGVFFLNSFLVSFLVLMLLDPLRSAMRFLTEKLLTPEYRHLDQSIAAAKHQLNLSTEPGEVVDILVRSMREILRPSRIGVFLLKHDGTRFERVRFHQEATATTLNKHGELYEVLLDNPLIEYCLELKRRGDLPVLLDQVLENERERSASRNQKDRVGGVIQGLKLLQSNALIPMFDQGNILGFVALEVSKPPEYWGSSWGLFSIIYPYIEFVGNKVRNIEVYVHQRERERLAVIGEMAAGLAHEIRNPLGAIKGAAQHIEPDSETPDGKFLHVIVDEVDRLNRVVTQFLEYSKPYQAEYEKTDVCELVTKSIESLKSLVPSEIDLQLQLPDTPIAIQAAPVQIQQVLVNLIQNSLKALHGRPDGRISVSVSLISGGSEVRLNVEDNGPGIPRPIIKKLFIPFFTTSPTGTGLGLPICRRIVEAHKGRIDVVSEEGRFARFSVLLPTKGLDSSRTVTPGRSEQPAQKEGSN